MLAERIKKLIKDKGYNQVEFANKIGVTRSTLLGQIDRPSFSTMEKIARALDVPVWELFVDPKEVRGIPDDPGFTALVKSGERLYSANSLEELHALVDLLEKG